MHHDWSFYWWTIVGWNVCIYYYYYGQLVMAGNVLAMVLAFMYYKVVLVVPREHTAFVIDNNETVHALDTGRHLVVPLFHRLFRMHSTTQRKPRSVFSNTGQLAMLYADRYTISDTCTPIVLENLSMRLQYHIVDTQKFATTCHDETWLTSALLRDLFRRDQPRLKTQAVRLQISRQQHDQSLWSMTALEKYLQPVVNTNADDLEAVCGIRIASVKIDFTASGDDTQHERQHTKKDGDRGAPLRTLE